MASRRLRAVTLHVEGAVDGVGGSEGCVGLELRLIILLPLLMLLRMAVADLDLRLACFGWIMGGPGTARGAGTGKGDMMIGGSLFSFAGVGGAFWQV